MFYFMFTLHALVCWSLTATLSTVRHVHRKWSNWCALKYTIFLVTIDVSWLSMHRKISSINVKYQPALTYCSSTLVCTLRLFPFPAVFLSPLGPTSSLVFYSLIYVDLFCRHVSISYRGLFSLAYRAKFTRRYSGECAHCALIR